MVIEDEIATYFEVGLRRLSLSKIFLVLFDFSGIKYVDLVTDCVLMIVKGRSIFDLNDISSFI